MLIANQLGKDQNRTQNCYAILNAIWRCEFLMKLGPPSQTIFQVESIQIENYKFNKEISLNNLSLDFNVDVGSHE